MAQLRGLKNFKAQLTGGGARPNLFVVELDNLPARIDQETAVQELRETPSTTFTKYESTDAEKFQYMCKAAALPASNIGAIEVPFRGRTFKVAGDRTFDTWTVTIINDEDFRLRNTFEHWMQMIGQYSDHAGAVNPQSYMTNAVVKQLGRAPIIKQEDKISEGDSYVLAQYKFIDIFPINISQIDLSYDSTDTIEEFTVEFQVQFWFPEKADDDNPGTLYK